MTGTTRQIYICCLCNKELWDISDLEDHFNQHHVEKIDELKLKLNRSMGEGDGMMIFTITGLKITCT